GQGRQQRPNRRKGRPRNPPADPSSVLSRREDPDRDRGLTWEGEQYHAVPQGGLTPNLSHGWARSLPKLRRSVIGDTAPEATSTMAAKLRKNARLKAARGRCRP